MIFGQWQQCRSGSSGRCNTHRRTSRRHDGVKSFLRCLGVIAVVISPYRKLRWTLHRSRCKLSNLRYRLFTTIIENTLTRPHFPQQTALIMKRPCILLLYVYVLLALSPRVLAQKDCNKIESESGKTRCLEQKTTSAESRLNSVLERIVSFYSVDREDLSDTPAVMQVVKEADKRTTEALRKSQSDWMAYRDSACEAVGDSYEGGTASAQAIPSCRLRLTEDRIMWLQTNFNDALHNQGGTGPRR